MSPPDTSAPPAAASSAPKPHTGTFATAEPGESDVILFVAVSPDGRYLASGSERLSLWHLEQGRLRWSNSGPVADVAFTPDSKTLAAAFNAVTPWDSETGERVRTLTHGPAPLQLVSGGNYLLAGSQVLVLKSGGLRAVIRVPSLG